MSAAEHPPARPSLRERRRAAATQEILAAAESQITEQGPHALSLRAVARSLGMTVQALYHYFPSRDALVTALIVKAYDDLADAVQAAVDARPADSAADRAAAPPAAPPADPPADPPVPGMVAAAEGYRRWAIAHPELFQLLYGTPLRQYAAPVGGSTTRAMLRMSAIFQREMFAGFTQAQLAAADAPELSPEFREYLGQLSPEGPGALPAPASALLLGAWGNLHGLVVLEVFGHTAFLGDHQAELFRMAMRNTLADVHSRIPT